MLRGYTYIRNANCCAVLSHKLKESHACFTIACSRFYHDMQISWFYYAVMAKSGNKDMFFFTSNPIDK